MIPSFPKIFHIGDHHIPELFNGPVEVTEKIDGSAFSFANIDGKYYARSKGKELYFDAPEKMFAKAITYTHELFEKGLLIDGLVYHGEFLQSPSHNSLSYSRVPNNHIMLYGIRNFAGNSLVSDYGNLVHYASLIGLEVVPLLYQGNLERQEVLDKVNSWIDRESILGGPKMEGLVIKNYAHEVMVANQIVPLVCGKYVSEAFKEVHKVGWVKNNPTTLDKLADAFSTEARWEKAIATLRDNGQLSESVKDIGPLIKQVVLDIETEERDNIKEALWHLFEKDIKRFATRQIPTYYKQRLMNLNG